MLWAPWYKVSWLSEVCESLKIAGLVLWASAFYPCGLQRDSGVVAGAHGFDAIFWF